MYKSIGNQKLTWAEFEDVLLDIEITLNNRPLTYIEDDVEMPLLTPNTLIHGVSTTSLEDQVDDIEDVDLRKRAKYLKRYKDIYGIKSANIKSRVGASRNSCKT